MADQAGSTPPVARARKRDLREDEMERVAECHCGQLRAITSGEPDSVYVCHCKACQRRTGAVIHNGSRWLKSQVRIEGEHKIYGRIADSGFEIRFHKDECRLCVQKGDDRRNAPQRARRADERTRSREGARVAVRHSSA
jgi:hypothetical protein